MWLGIGFRKTMKTLLRFPALILMPVWTFWMIGPRSQFSISKWRCLKLGNNNKTLVVSFFWTWLNACLTLLGHLIFFFIFVLPITSESTYFYRDITEMLKIILYSIPWSLLILSLVLLIVLQCLDRCKQRIPCCCGNSIQRTVFDPDDVQSRVSNGTGRDVQGLSQDKDIVLQSITYLE